MLDTIPTTIAIHPWMHPLVRHGPRSIASMAGLHLSVTTIRKLFEWCMLAVPNDALVVTHFDQKKIRFWGKVSIPVSVTKRGKNKTRYCLCFVLMLEWPRDFVKGCCWEFAVSLCRFDIKTLILEQTGKRCRHLPGILSSSRSLTRLIWYVCSPSSKTKNFDVLIKQKIFFADESVCCKLNRNEGEKKKKKKKK